MGLMYGADAEELEQIASELEGYEKELGQLLLEGVGAVSIVGLSATLNTIWRGPRASDFAGVWEARHLLRIRDVQAMLSEAAGDLRRNADEQRRTSSTSRSTRDGFGTLGPWFPSFSVPTGFMDIERLLQEMVGNPGVDSAMIDILRSTLQTGTLDWGFLDAIEIWSADTEFFDFAREYSLGGASGGEFGPGGYAVEGRLVAAMGSSAQGSASIGPGGADFAASAEASAYLGLDGQGEYRVGSIAAVGSASAIAGVLLTAGATGGIGPDGASLNLRGEALLGARVRADGSVGLGNSATVGGSAEAWAGLGVKGEADIDVGFDEIGIDFELGAAIGIGGSFGIDVSFSPTGIASDVGGLAGGAADYMADKWPF